MCTVSKKLVNDMLISATAYEILLENIQLFDFGNQRDFESTNGKDIEYRKEMKELRKETENETRITQTRHKEEEQVKLKAEEERRMMEEERRMNERIALEEEMILKKERWLVEEQIRHVQVEHKMRMKEQKCLPEGRYDVAQPVAVEEEKGLSRDSSNVPLIFAEDETYEILKKLKLPKRKHKELSRMLVTKLQRKVNLKASNNFVLVLQHWSFKQEYSQDKRGIGTLAWKLPDFIKRIDIGKVRQSLRERRSRDNESQDEETKEAGQAHRQQKRNFFGESKEGHDFENRDNFIVNQGRNFLLVSDTEPPSYRGSDMCNYSPTNRALISKKVRRRSFDTGAPQS
ncbi:hypothetical protein TNCV_618601 [Trichonephila clavipes]|nr:hypothetical protein TNCV_618601 [Trichonephila clavipes]